MTAEEIAYAIYRRTAATGEYTVRPAVRSDSRFIYGLSMDPRIRSMSTRHEEFTFEEHEKWYEDRLTSGLDVIWVMEIGGIPVGQVRYGRTWSCGRPLAEIAISVVPHEWRKGRGLTLLKETMGLAREWLEVDTLAALVLRRNYPSRRLFRRAGFRYVGLECRMEQVHVRYEWVPLA